MPSNVIDVSFSLEKVEVNALSSALSSGVEVIPKPTNNINVNLSLEKMEVNALSSALSSGVKVIPKPTNTIETSLDIVADYNYALGDTSTTAVSEMLTAVKSIFENGLIWEGAANVQYALSTDNTTTPTSWTSIEKGGSLDVKTGDDLTDKYLWVQTDAAITEITFIGNNTGPQDLVGSIQVIAVGSNSLTGTLTVGIPYYIPFNKIPTSWQWGD